MSIDFLPPISSSTEADIDWRELEADVRPGGEEDERQQELSREEQCAHQIGHVAITRACEGKPSVTMTFGNVTLTQPGRVPGAHLKK